MSKRSIIVWDLETVPDLAAAARLFDMGAAGDAEGGFPESQSELMAAASRKWFSPDRSKRSLDIARVMC